MAETKDYHGHPNYNAIFAALVVLMALSVVADQIIPGAMGKVVIFAFSAVKAYLVIANFMHLKYEPVLVDLFPYLSVALMIVLFFGVAPDTLLIDLKITE